MEIDDVVHQTVEKLHEALGHPTIEDERKKIEHKFQEARYNPGEVRVWADCILALLLAARSQGFTTKTVLDELSRVAKDALSKKWKKMPDGTHQAV